MADWPYSTAAWQRLRRLKLSEQPLCEVCARRGRHIIAEHVDHIVSIASGGPAFPETDGLMALCPSCHSIKTRALDQAGGKRVAIKGCDADGLPLDPAHGFLDREERPVTLVCGPPGAGKSTHVARHRKGGDLVLDLDAIMAALSGEPLYGAPVEMLPFACEARDAVLRRLQRSHALRHAWVIMGGPRAADREPLVWSLNARVMILDTPADVCRERIMSDDRRPPAEREQHLRAVDDWWREFEPHIPLQGRGAAGLGPPAGAKNHLVRDWSV